DGEVRPLPLGLDAEMSPDRAEDDVERPARDEPGDDLGWRHDRVGTEQGLRLERLGRIAEQHPAQRDGRLTGVIPEGGAGRGLHLSDPAAVPGDARRLPGSVRIEQASREGGLARTRDAWAPFGPGRA